VPTSSAASPPRVLDYVVTMNHGSGSAHRVYRHYLHLFSYPGTWPRVRCGWTPTSGSESRAPPSPSPGRVWLDNRAGGAAANDRLRATGGGRHQG
jgi:hypothetical protein